MPQKSSKRSKSLKRKSPKHKSPRKYKGSYNDSRSSLLGNLGRALNHVDELMVEEYLSVEPKKTIVLNEIKSLLNKAFEISEGLKPKFHLPPSYQEEVDMIA
jgi:hypothetical protein